MESGEDYRDKFYSEYYANQVSKRHDGLESRLEADRFAYTHQILPHIPDEQDIEILDIGCGFGSLIYTLKKAGYENVKGIDVSSDQIKQARQLGLNEVREANLFEYLDQHQSWDVIVAIDLIEHFTKSEVVELLKKIRSALTPDGRFIVRTPNIDALFGSVYAYGDFTHGHMLNKSSARQLFRTSGFSEVSIYAARVHYQSFFKRSAQTVLKKLIYIIAKGIFFVQGRSIKQVLLSPNMIIVADRQQV